MNSYKIKKNLVLTLIAIGFFFPIVVSCMQRELKELGTPSQIIVQKKLFKHNRSSSTIVNLIYEEIHEERSEIKNQDLTNIDSSSDESINFIDDFKKSDLELQNSLFNSTVADTTPMETDYSKIEKLSNYKLHQHISAFFEASTKTLASTKPIPGNGKIIVGPMLIYARFLGDCLILRQDSNRDGLKEYCRLFIQNYAVLKQKNQVFANLGPEKISDEEKKWGIKLLRIAGIE